MSLGKRIGALRRKVFVGERPMTQKALSIATGISQPRISRLENGDSDKVSPDEWIKLVRALKTTINTLIGIESEKSTSLEQFFKGDPQAQELVKWFKKLSDRGRSLLVAQAKLLREYEVGGFVKKTDETEPDSEDQA